MTLTPCVLTPMALIFVAAHEVTEEVAECVLVRYKVSIFLLCSTVDGKKYFMENM